MVKDRFKVFPTVHLLLMDENEDKILLLRRFNTGYEDGNYSVIAGHLEEDEEIKVAMVREAREEAGIELSLQDLQVVGAMYRKSAEGFADFFLTTTTWSGKIINREPDKCDLLGWFDMNNLPENVISYVRKAIENSKEAIEKYRHEKSNIEQWIDIFGWS